ncbi:MAG: caspase family protein [Saprospiraceae bacterium]|nr:caspase family protein [Saprospiraceae bacterium]
MAQQSRLLLLLLLLSIFAFDLPAQRNGTLHLITAIDGINDDIAQGCKKDYENADELFKFIAQTGGMEYRLHNLSFDQTEVASFIQDFHCDPEDLVVFLYSGHGFRYDNDGDFWPWPFMYFCNREEMDIYSETCELDLEDLRDDLINKNPRMTLVIGNSCNEMLDNEAGGPATESEDMDLSDSDQALQGVALFTEFRGHILTSASGPGQKAYTTDDHGAYFIIEFFKHIAEALDAQEPTSWKNILGQTKHSVTERNSDQIPLFKIE